MAKVLYSHLCWGLKKDEQTNTFLPLRPFESLVWIDYPVLFTFVVYWTGHIGECFSQSFALVDEAGNILDEMPKMECVLTSHFDTIGAAYFYTIFPRIGRYFINVLQNDICIEDVPLNVIDVLEISSIRRSSLQ